MPYHTGMHARRIHIQLIALALLLGSVAVAILIAPSLADEQVVSTSTHEQDGTAENVVDVEHAVDADVSETEVQTLETYTPLSSDADSLPVAADSIESFSLNSLDSPTLTDPQLERVEQAIAQVETLGDLGFVLINLDTGLGMAYNTDARVYGASSFKAMYAIYLCQYLIEQGELTLDDWCPSSDSAYSVRNLIEASIIDSDNDAYRLLRAAYEGMGLETWLASIGITETTPFLWYFPTYTPRISATLWLNAYTYFQSNTELAQWIQQLCNSTVTSFLRSGINDESATVYNKAGWYPSEDTAYSAVVDAGIVVDGEGNTYLISIMTSMSYDTSSVEAYQELAAALYELRTLFNAA